PTSCVTTPVSSCRRASRPTASSRSWTCPAARTRWPASSAPRTRSWMPGRPSSPRGSPAAATSPTIARATSSTAATPAWTPRRGRSAAISACPCARSERPATPRGRVVGMAEDCMLCRAERITPWFHEDEICWVAECEICETPMVVWREHGVEPPPEHLSHMLAHLKDVAERQIGEHWLDRHMRNIPDHWHAELLDVLRAAALPQASRDHAYAAAMVPFQLHGFYATPPMERLLMTEDWRLKGRINLDAPMVGAMRRAYAYALVLQRLYGIELELDHPLILSVPDPETGLDRHFRLLFDWTFVEVEATGPLPELPSDMCHRLQVNLLDAEGLSDLLPSDRFVLRGFTILKALEV